MEGKDSKEAKVMEDKGTIKKVSGLFSKPVHSMMQEMLITL